MSHIAFCRVRSGGDAICDNAAVANRIDIPAEDVRRVNVLHRQLWHEKLFSGQAACRVHLAGKGGVEGLARSAAISALGSMSIGELRVGQQPGAVVENPGNMRTAPPCSITAILLRCRSSLQNSASTSKSSVKILLKFFSAPYMLRCGFA